jgi:hypothetical protein
MPRVEAVADAVDAAVDAVEVVDAVEAVDAVVAVVVAVAAECGGASGCRAAMRPGIPVGISLTAEQESLRSFEPAASAAGFFTCPQVDQNERRKKNKEQVECAGVFSCLPQH